MSGQDAPEGSLAQVSCREVLEQLERYLDGELPERRLDQLRVHLTECYPCSDRASFEEQVRALVRGCASEKAPPGLMERIRQRLDSVTSDRGGSDQG